MVPQTRRSSGSRSPSKAPPIELSDSSNSEIVIRRPSAYESHGTDDQMDPEKSGSGEKAGSPEKEEKEEEEEQVQGEDATRATSAVEGPRSPSASSATEIAEAAQVEATVKDEHQQDAEPITNGEHENGVAIPDPVPPVEKGVPTANSDAPPPAPPAVPATSAEPAAQSTTDTPNHLSLSAPPAPILPSPFSSKPLSTASFSGAEKHGAEKHDDPVSHSDSGSTAPAKKPRQKRQQRSPSPPPRPIEPPLKTLRLTIPLGGEDYMYSVMDVGRKLGLVEPLPPGSEPAAPPPPPVVQSDSEDDAPVMPVKRKRGRPVEEDAYDVDDPFVDDSELYVDEPQFAGRPRQEGFYVSLGDVELMPMPTPKKPKKNPLALPYSTRPLFATAGANHHVTTKPRKRAYLQPLPPTSSLFPKPPPAPETASPTLPGAGAVADVLNPAVAAGLSTPGSEEGKQLEGATGTPAKVEPSPASASGGTPSLDGKKKKDYPVVPFSPTVQHALDCLAELVQKESFEIKAKFPPGLRQPLLDTAKLALEHDEYGDNFFNYLPRIFPYNRFTMLKLTKNMMYQHHRDFLQARLEICYQTFKEEVDREAPEQIAAWEAQYAAWEAQQVQRKAEGGEGTSDAQSNGPTSSANGTPNPEDPAAPPAPLKPKVDEPPRKRWRWTEKQNVAMLGMTDLQEEIYRLDCDKAELDKAPVPQHKEQAQRSLVYARLSKLFPDGWMHTTDISRKRTQLMGQKKRMRTSLNADSGGEW